MHVPLTLLGLLFYFLCAWRFRLMKALKFCTHISLGEEWLNVYYTWSLWVWPNHLAMAFKLQALWHLLPTSTNVGSHANIQFMSSLDDMTGIIQTPQRGLFNVQGKRWRDEGDETLLKLLLYFEGVSMVALQILWFCCDAGPPMSKVQPSPNFSKWLRVLDQRVWLQSLPHVWKN